MTILFVSHYAGFYGAAKSLYALILDLRNRYDINPVVLLQSKGPLCQYLEKSNIKYYITPYYWWVNNNKGFFQYLLNKRKQIINLYRLQHIYQMLEPEAIDLVYSNSVTINIGFLLAKRLGCPHIWHFRESLKSFSFSLSLSLSLSKRILLDNTNIAYILISKYLVNYYRNLLPQERVCLIYNGVFIPKFFRKDNVLQNGILKVCIVGVINEQKNQMDAVKAINILKQKSKINICLYLIGSEVTTYSDGIRNYIREYGLDKNVVLLGHSNNIDELLDKMNIGIMSSRDEAFGRVTIEYMAHSMPVIASNSGANTELVVEGQNGFIYNLYDVEELANKILYFGENPCELQRMGRISRKMAEKNYTIEKNTDLIYQQISKTLKQ